MREKRHGLRTVFLLQFRQPGGEPVERLVPADVPEPPLAALAHAQLRPLQAVGVIEGELAGVAARAEPALCQRVLRIAFDPRDLAILHLGQHAAAPEAHLAVGCDLKRPFAASLPGRRGRAGRLGGACRRSRCAKPVPAADAVAHAWGLQIRRFKSGLNVTGSVQPGRAPAGRRARRSRL